MTLKHFTKYTICAVLITSTGCFMSDDIYEELSGDYLYRGEGGELNEIRSHYSSKPEIYGRVLSYGYNKDFIVAYQKPSFDGYRSNIGFKLRDDSVKYPTNSAEEQRLSEKIADSILKNDPYYKRIFAQAYNYWIISHKDGKLYGPFSESEYFKKRKELDIPDRLQLREP